MSCVLLVPCLQQEVVSKRGSAQLYLRVIINGFGCVLVDVVERSFCSALADCGRFLHDTRGAARALRASQMKRTLGSVA